MSLIPLIKEKMEERNLSVNKLANIIGISPSTLARHLNGETKKMSTKLEQDLKGALGITFEMTTDYIQKEIKSKEIHNMEYKDTFKNSQCTVCGVFSDKDNSIKELSLGRNNQVICANLCSECRKKLVYETLKSLDI